MYMYSVIMCLVKFHMESWWYRLLSPAQCSSCCSLPYLDALPCLAFYSLSLALPLPPSLLPCADDVMMTMKLFYYDEGNPYAAVFFCQSFATHLINHCLHPSLPSLPLSLPLSSSLPLSLPPSLFLPPSLSSSLPPSLTTVTPSDYEPPGFQATTTDDFIFTEKPMNIRVGDVDTVSTHDNHMIIT